MYERTLAALAVLAPWVLGTVLGSREARADSGFVEDNVRVIRQWEGESPGDQFGWVARRIGDVDGDNVTDIVTSAPTHATGGENAGRVYVYSTKTGELLWTADGETNHWLGLGVEGAGDVNDDGVADVIAGAPGAGSCYVYHGATGETLLTLHAEAIGEGFGWAVGALGDWNDDGHDDVLVGARTNDAGGEDAGRAYVFSGKDGARLETLTGSEKGGYFGSEVAGLVDTAHRMLVIGAMNAGESNRGRVFVYKDATDTPAFVIDADDTGVHLGRMFVSVVGDLDADGVSDVYASDWNDAGLGKDTGRVYLHSGKTGERLHTISGKTPGAGFGIGVADAGDVNRDGHDDLIIGAWQDPSGVPGGGKVWVFSGADASELRTLTSKTENDTFGFDTTNLGDVDGDGEIDFLITSAWSPVSGEKTGRVLIIAGRSD